MSFTDNLNLLIKKYDLLSEKLAQGALVLGTEFVSLSKEYSILEPIVALIKNLENLEKNLKELELIVEDKTSDIDLKILAKEEIPNLRDNIDKLSYEIKIALLSKDKDDDKNAILEIRAGTGGEEAALFAGNLFRMYHRYADTKRWKTEILSSHETGKGGYKEIIASIIGRGVYAKLKYESGVHRVQRIPDTESNGRVHTSAATVAVLPEVADIDIKIDEKDIRIDVYRASGAGGQHVNTTDSAVRITHVPTGIVVTQQDEKSQHKNRAKAMKILMAKLYENEKRKIDTKRSESRKHQVGSGDRSERIRTYNYPQGRVSDHRINLTLYKLDSFMEGELDEMIEAIISIDEAEKLIEKS